jgi:hypothetical protein
MKGRDEPMIQIEIDDGSGFCFGVTTAIKKAEEELCGRHESSIVSAISCTTAWSARG